MTTITVTYKSFVIRACSCHCVLCSQDTDSIVKQSTSIIALSMLIHVRLSHGGADVAAVLIVMPNDMVHCHHHFGGTLHQPSSKQNGIFYLEDESSCFL
jgi:hypothetical protein